MQYFSKFLGGASTGLPGYTLNEIIAWGDISQIWQLNRAINKENGKDSLVFTFSPGTMRPNIQATDAGRLAKSAVMRLKTLRHPDILKFLDSLEGTDGSVHVATEFAVPLSTRLKSGKLTSDEIMWGLLSISRALAFLHNANMIHGRMSDHAIFVTKGGDWKLGAFEATVPVANAMALRETFMLQPEAYRSPETVRGSWNQMTTAVDTWALGCLLYGIHADNFTSPEQLRNIDVIPQPLRQVYQQFLASAPMERAPVSAISEMDCMTKSKFVEMNLFIENMALKDSFEKEAFFNRLPSVIDKVPVPFAVYKLLPLLDTNITAGVAGAACFSAIVKLQSRLSEAEFGKEVVSKYAKAWYGNTGLDRAVRVDLLKNMDKFVPFFDEATLNDVIFPAYCTGFQDAQSPALRDLSVKTLLCFADKLNERNLNTQLMSHMAKLQLDPEAPIRTNTTVCLSKLSSKMSDSGRKKVLVAAFLRALKDPFPPARNASLNAFLDCAQYVEISEVANRLIPALGPLLLDADASVRASALKCLEHFLPSIRGKIESMNRSETAKSQLSENAAATSGGSWAVQGFSALAGKLASAGAGNVGGGGGNGSPVAPPVPNGSIPTDTPLPGLASGFGSQSMPPTGLQPAVIVGKPANQDGGAKEEDEYGREEEDGWGDFAGPETSEPKSDLVTKASGMTLNSSKATAVDDWDFGLPPVNKPLPTQLPMSSAASSFGSGSSSVASTIRSTPQTAVHVQAALQSPQRMPAGGSARKAGDDDWGALLGSTAKPRNRGGPPKLGATRK